MPHVLSKLIQIPQNLSNYNVIDVRTSVGHTVLVLLRCARESNTGNILETVTFT